MDILNSTAAFGASEKSELEAIIGCHAALNDKSEGKSTMLGYDGPTPFVVPAGKHLYFVSSDSISTIENKFANKTIVFKFHDKDRPIYSKIDFQKNGDLGTISFEKLTSEELQSATLTNPKFDDESLQILKKELVLRMNSVVGEYQNKYDPQGTIDSLLACKKVKSPGLTASLEKQIEFYKKLADKKYGAKAAPAKKTGGSQ